MDWIKKKLLAGIIKREVKKMEGMLAGKGTYLTGIAMIFFAVSGLLLGKVDANTAFQTASTGFGLIFVRRAIENK